MDIASFAVVLLAVLIIGVAITAVATTIYVRRREAERLRAHFRNKRTD